MIVNILWGNDLINYDLIYYDLVKKIQKHLQVGVYYDIYDIEWALSVTEVQNSSAANSANWLQVNK